MVAPIEQTCVLARFFADFGLLPDLLALRPARDDPQFDKTGRPIFMFMRPEVDEELTARKWTRLLEDTKLNTDHIEPEDRPNAYVFHTVLAEDARQLARRLRLIEGKSLSETGRRLAGIGERPWDERTEADDHTVEATIEACVREYYVCVGGLDVVDLLTGGAERLAQTDHIWASYVPGLLLAEFEALIHWAFKDRNVATSIRDELVQLRDVAMHRHGQPSPDVAPEENLIRLADATTALYYDTEELAGRTELTITEVRSTAMLLTYAGTWKSSPWAPSTTCTCPRSNHGRTEF